MPFRVSGKNIDIGEALRERVNQRIAEAIAKYFDGGYSGHVTIGKEGFGFRTECVVHLDSGIVLQAEAMAADAYAAPIRRPSASRSGCAATSAGSRIITPARAQRPRCRRRATIDAPSYVIAAPEQDSRRGDHRVQSGHHRRIDHRAETLSVSEAVMQLDMTGTPVMVFRHAGHGRVNLVYRRPTAISAGSTRRPMASIDGRH